MLGVRFGGVNGNLRKMAAVSDAGMAGENQGGQPVRKYLKKSQKKVDNYKILSNVLLGNLSNTRYLIRSTEICK